MQLYQLVRLNSVLRVALRSQLLAIPVLLKKTEHSEQKLQKYLCNNFSVYKSMSGAIIARKQQNIEFSLPTTRCLNCTITSSCHVTSGKMGQSSVKDGVLWAKIFLIVIAVGWYCHNEIQKCLKQYVSQPWLCPKQSDIDVIIKTFQILQLFLQMLSDGHVHTFHPFQYTLNVTKQHLLT